jgi:transcriptional regulator GlxA family with amidase domain
MLFTALTIAQISIGRNDNVSDISAIVNHHVVFVAFEGFQLLDLTGPAAVYGAANDRLGWDAYRITMVGPEAPVALSNSGVSLNVSAFDDVRPETVDSFFISGGNEAGQKAFIANEQAKDWVWRAIPSSIRYGSICSGSVALAAWGLIGTRRFAAHWDAVSEVRRRWPELQLDPESLYVNDGPLWTSAGVTAGIDMALAIVEVDHGPDVARAVAQRLVLSVRRPGWQSQYSAALSAQGTRDGRYADVIAWIAANLAGDLSVEQLADRAGESERSFHRNFTEAVGETPARYVMTQRLNHARALIEQGHSLKSVASQCGFADPAPLSKAFKSRFGMTAGAYRLVNGR